MSVHSLDVRLEERYRIAHIPGSTVNPVFQMGFIDRLPEEWATSDEILLIGEDSESAEAKVALEKLTRAGYHAVSILEGGMQGWISEGNQPESTADAEHSPSPLRGDHPVNLSESELQWTGRNLLNRHYGTLKFSSGTLHFEENQLTGGTFEIDWDSLTCTDLAGSPMHEVLMAHLKDHDFFDVDVFDPPTVTITRVHPLPDPILGSPNLAVEIDLTMKGITKPMWFHAISGQDGEGRFALQAVFDFDRTEWDVLYGSGRFFKNLGMHLVNDRIEIGLKVVTSTQ